MAASFEQSDSRLFRSLHRARYLCGATFREGTWLADGSLDKRGYRGGTADMIASSLRLQAPWLAAARSKPSVPFKVVLRLPAVQSTQLMREICPGGTMQRIRELLAAGAPTSQPTSSRDAFVGSTLLHWAILRRDLRVLSVLAQSMSGTPAIDATNAQGSTPLMLACRFNVKIVRTLLLHGARQDQQNNSGRAALHVAAFMGNKDIVEALCAAPGAAAALAKRDDSSATPLTRALMQGHRAIAAVLRAAGGLE